MERAMTLPFSIDASGSVSSSNTPQKIWQSRVIAAVMTNLGERVFRPTYGGSIKSSIFEPEESAKTMITSSIRSVFGKSLEQLVLNDIQIVMDPQFGLLTTTIYYTLPDETKDNVTIVTGNLNRSGDIIQEL